MVLHVRATGYQLLAFRYGLRQHSVGIDLSSLLEGRKTGRREEIHLSLMPLLREHLPQGRKPVSLVGSDPDSLHLALERYDSVKVPVRPRAELSFSGDFALAGPLRSNPDSIWLRGPESAIGQITYIESETLKIKGLRDDIRQRASLSLPSTLLLSDLNEVEIIGDVERFTEKTIVMEVPMPDGYSPEAFMLLPAKVDVKVAVAMSKYSQAAESDITIEVRPEGNASVVRLTALSGKPYLKIIGVEPSEVEIFKVKR